LRWFCILLALGAAVFVSRYTVLKGNPGSPPPFSYLRDILPAGWWPLFFFVHFVWAWLYVILRLREARVRKWRDLREAIRSRSILDVEAITLLTIAGAAPGVLLPVGLNAFYFSDVQRWFALALVLSATASLIALRDRLRGKLADGMFAPTRILAVCIGIPLAFVAVLNFTHWAGGMIGHNMASRREIRDRTHASPFGLKTALVQAAKGVVHGRSSGLAELQHGALDPLFDGGKLRSGLRADSNYRIISALDALQKLPSSEKRRTFVFIPQSLGSYWNLLRTPDKCGYASLITPAVTGMAMIDGLPPLGCKTSTLFELMRFEPRTSQQTLEDAAPASLCAKARHWGGDQVIVLSDLPSAGIVARRIRCVGERQIAG
jgi:hypothetical protein